MTGRLHRGLLLAAAAALAGAAAAQGAADRVSAPPPANGTALLRAALPAPAEAPDSAEAGSRAPLLTLTEAYRLALAQHPSVRARIGGVRVAEQELEALAAVSIAVVEGLGIQRALDPEGFDHEAAWRAWRAVVGAYLALPGPQPGRG